MAVTIGFDGTAVAWTGGNNAQLAGTGTVPNEFQIHLDCEEFDATAFDTTVNGGTAFATAGSANYIKGLKSWSFDYAAMLKVPDHGGGTAGLVTFSAGYVVSIDKYALTITRDSFRSTSFDTTSTKTHTFAPGLIRGSGVYSGFQDDTSPVIFPGSANEPASMILKYQEKGGTDNTLTFSAFCNRLNVAASKKALNAVDYAFRMRGPVTQSTPSAGAGIITAGDLTGDAANTVTLTAATGRTFSGSAFWTKIEISVGIGALTMVRVSGQGSGSLSIDGVAINT